MKKIDNLEFKVNQTFNLTDKLNISIPSRDIFLNITDKFIKNAFIELYKAIPVNQINLLKAYEKALKSPEKLKKFLQRKDVSKYIAWNKQNLCYEFNFKIKLNLTNEIINFAFKALYPPQVNLKKEGDIEMEKKNKKINEMIRQAAGRGVDEKPEHENNNQNMDKDKKMNDEIRKQAGIKVENDNQMTIDLTSLDNYIEKKLKEVE